MEVKVDLSPEQINKTITEAIAKSAIGKELERVINEEVKKLSTSYNNPIENVVRNEINKAVQKLVSETYSSKIQEVIREKVNEKFTEDLFTKLWESFTSRL